MEENCTVKNDGCKFASEFLGHKSSCLECPFESFANDCIYGDRRMFNKIMRQAKARQLDFQGESKEEIALKLNVSLKTLNNYLK